MKDRTLVLYSHNFVQTKCLKRLEYEDVPQSLSVP